MGEAVSISRRLMSTDRLTHSRDNPESDLSPTHYQEPDQQNGQGGSYYTECAFIKNIISEA